MNLTLVAVVAVALFFDFTNGFHDTANSIATSVSTRALSPRMAVLTAAVLNFAGAFVSLKVAATVAKGIVDPEAITLKIVLAGLVGAITWIIRNRSPSKSFRVFRRLQIVSGSFVAFTHGTNDAQKTMGIISLALIASGHLKPEPFDVPTWVIASAATAMALGTYAGGWRIIKTLGTRIVKIDPPQGFAAQTACAGILWTTAHFGFPVSTTHTISGCVLGAGASRRLSAVRWGVAGNIVVAWLLTLPAAGLVGALMEVVTRLPGGDAVVFVLAGVIAAVAFLGRRYETRRLVPSPA